MKFNNLIFTLFILIFINCCSDQTIYTGKIINKNVEDYTKSKYVSNSKGENSLKQDKNKS